jgi:hypothetical protein
MPQAPAEQTLERKLKYNPDMLWDPGFDISMFDISIFLHSDQLMKERRTHHNLRNEWLYTADGAVYTMEKGKLPVLYLTRGHAHPILKKIMPSRRGYYDNEYFSHLSNEGVREALDSNDTLRVELPSLELEWETSEISFFPISTSKQSELSVARRPLAWRAYGEGDNFSKSMQLLRTEGGIKTTRIRVLNPEYVRNEIPVGAYLVRTCQIGPLDGDSRFDAFYRDVDIGSLLRIRRAIDYSNLVNLFMAPHFNVSQFARSLAQCPRRVGALRDALQKVINLNYYQG